MKKPLICHGCAEEIRTKPYYTVKVVDHKYFVQPVLFHKECLAQYIQNGARKVANVKEVT